MTTQDDPGEPSPHFCDHPATRTGEGDPRTPGCPAWPGCVLTGPTVYYDSVRASFVASTTPRQLTAELARAMDAEDLAVARAAGRRAAAKALDSGRRMPFAHAAAAALALVIITGVALVLLALSVWLAFKLAAVV